MTYRYEILSQREENLCERLLADYASEVSCLQLRIARPRVRFIDERADGFITSKHRLNAYAPPGGKEIFVRFGLSPTELVNAVLHECRHCFQWQTPAWRNRAEAAWERDAELYVHEFWAEHRRSGDHTAMMTTLATIKSEWLRAEIARLKAINRTRQLPGGFERATMTGSGQWK